MPVCLNVSPESSIEGAPWPSRTIPGSACQLLRPRSHPRRHPARPRHHGRPRRHGHRRRGHPRLGPPPRLRHLLDVPPAVRPADLAVRPVGDRHLDGRPGRPGRLLVPQLRRRTRRVPHGGLRVVHHRRPGRDGLLPPPAAAVPRVPAAHLRDRHPAPAPGALHPAQDRARDAAPGPAAAPRDRGRRAVRDRGGRRLPEPRAVRRLPRRRRLRARRHRRGAGAVPRAGPRLGRGHPPALLRARRRHGARGPRRLRHLARAAPDRLGPRGLGDRAGRRTVPHRRRRAADPHATGGGAAAAAPRAAAGRRGRRPLQAGLRRGLLAARSAGALPAAPGRRRPREGPRRGPGVLPAVPRRPRRRHLQDAQVPVDGRRRGAAAGVAAPPERVRRRPVQDEAGPADHPAGPVPAALLRRRGPAAPQRAARAR